MSNETHRGESPPAPRAPGANASDAADARLAAAAGLIGVFILVVLRNGVLTRAFADDAYIFLRYAHNTLRGDFMAWNPGGPPADGITSPLWFFACLAASAVAEWVGREPETLLKALLMAAAAFWIFAVYRMGRALWPGRSRLWIVLVIGLIILLDPNFEAACRRGMETLAAGGLVALTVYLYARSERLILRAREGTGGISNVKLELASLAGGLSGFLAVMTRPELGLFALIAPAALFWRHRSDRRGALYIHSLILITGLGILFILYKVLIIGSLVPWPAYVKNGWEVIYENYDRNSELRLRGFPIEFLRDYALLLIPAAMALVHRELRGSTLWIWAPLGLTYLYWLMTLQIMGYDMRYYQPLIPMILALGFAGASRGRLATASPLIRRWPMVALAALLCFGTVWNLWRIYLYQQRHPIESARLFFRPSEPAPRMVARLKEAPAGLKAAATEVGILGYHCPQIEVIDLSGLNDRMFSEGFDAERFFDRRPDVILLVHYHYQGMIAKISRHPEFKYFRPVFIPDRSPPEILDLTHRIYADTRSPHYEALVELGRKETPGSEGGDLLPMNEKDG